MSGLISKDLGTALSGDFDWEEIFQPHKWFGGDSESATRPIIPQNLKGLLDDTIGRWSAMGDAGWDQFMPGHGGMLDRVDGVLFAVPVLYYFRTYLL